ncbi:MULTISPECIES: hypothetical protein [Pectobacterium]|uniref:hypothetical protein n=1 Tax=Pectobacterium TaxID=122277 RepID=UPI000CD02145|nr:hypothetical protein [Pectobacterium odoriferum]
MSVIDIIDVKNRNVLESLNLFIDKMNNLVVSKTSISWGDDKWIMDSVAIKFTKVIDKPSNNELMISDFMNFAKAYIIHEYPCKPNRLKLLISALRCFEHVLVKMFACGNICNVNYSVLDEIITFIKKRYSNTYVLKINKELKNIVLFLHENKLTYKSIGGWKSSIRNKIIYDGNNSNKLPKEKVLHIFADIFSQELTDIRDIFTTSTFVLLMSAPSRISEVLSLSANCMFTNRTKKGDQKWGLRFWAGKGFGGDIKWIPSVMVPITQKAIDRVMDSTKEARQFTKLMELDFRSFHEKSKFKNYNENEPLTIFHVCEVLYNKSFSEKECKKLLKRLSLKFYDNAYSLKTLWQELQKRLPEGFPWYNKERNIKFSDLLFLFFKDTFHPKKSDNRIEIYIPKGHLFQGNIITGRKKSNIFRRHGYKNEHDGSIYFHSHQIRHLLNTIAQRNGMTEYELAKWSGRVSIKQNRVYNHVSEEEILEKYESLKLMATNYSISEAITVRDPVSRESLLSLNHSAVHKTEFGYCVHDYTLSPCERFRDCLNCSEQICVKGNFDNLKRLKERLSDTNELIDITIKNTSENESQVDKDRWLTFHLKTKERLQELIDILESKHISDGSFVRLSNKSYSHLSRTINEGKLLNHRKENIYGKKIN